MSGWSSVWLACTRNANNRSDYWLNLKRASEICRRPGRTLAAAREGRIGQPHGRCGKQRSGSAGCAARGSQKLTTARTALTRRAGRLRQLEEACGRVRPCLSIWHYPKSDHANELLDDLTGGEMRVMSKPNAPPNRSRTT